MLRHWVLQPQLVRVQHRPRRTLGLEPVPVGVAVNGVAEQGVAQVLHVHAHLVRAPRANQHSHHRPTPVVSEGMHEAGRLAALALLRDRLQGCGGVDAWMRDGAKARMRGCAEGWMRGGVGCVEGWNARSGGMRGCAPS